ncbi:MAG: hypothetical protein JWO36_5054 [Myxococcales bacterium]|nr:hypothetical protein [Myxococcales bacterium]
MIKVLGCMMFAMVACGGAKPATTTTTTPTETTATDPAAKSLLTIGELAFANGDDVGVKLHPDGNVEGKAMHSQGGKPAVEEWKTFAQLARDGRVMHDGKAAGQLKADGSFVMADGQVAPFKIEGTTLTLGDKRVSIDDKGIIQGTNANAPQMRVTGLTDDGSRRAALLIIGLMFGAEGHANGDGPAAGK